MGSPSTNAKILYRNSRLVRMVFLQLHRQQRANLFCDVVLRAEGEAVPAHCCILSACSPFFTERLKREMPPKGGHKVVLELRGLKIGPLRKLVDFLYTSEMEVSREEAQDVLATARRLQVSELESLQLEGGKLVKKALGRRLNRECLQLSSPITIPEASPMQSPPVSGGSSLTSLLLARKQHTAEQLPCTKGIGNGSNKIHKETVQEKPAMLNEDKYQMPEDPAAMTEFLKSKAKKHLASTVTNILGSGESVSLRTEQGRPRDEQGMAGLQESKKIKISRSKLSSLHLPMPCTTEDHDVIVSSKTSKSIKRLWRKKSPPVKDEAKGTEAVSHLHGFLSPPPLPKATKIRKRSSSEPAPSSNHPQEAGQVGRVKLRKVINGSCWEVVQEPSAAQRAADSVWALTKEGSLPQCRHPEQEVTARQQHASSTKLLPAKAKSSRGVVNLVEGDGVGGDSNQMFMLNQMAKSEQCDNLASAGELEHMLDFLPVDDAVSVGESQGTTVPEGKPASGPAPKAKTKSQAQVLLRSPLQHDLECKLPPHLAILEEDEIDVGGIEEFFLNTECVRPDPSPVSENEVDVVNL
ncbi:BTB/POZ domain-containing protein 18 [Eublepharis macularius]|uniref:BTB/POZ domain-containing protein 18 n=1 Tax=Eublepharis macularius TaxID=481883 RepID=A0AA97IUV2_EUBMA|nr:BTB/POZ domain-containing protein 18 [Eublepharis macularius]